MQLCVLFNGFGGALVDGFLWCSNSILVDFNPSNRLKGQTRRAAISNRRIISTV